MDRANAQSAIVLAAAVLLSGSIAAALGVPARVDERPSRAAAAAALEGAADGD
jgi:hypothetical protein